MKKLLLLSCALLTMHSMNAGNHYGRQQSSKDDNKKFTFSFNAGVGIPLMDFAKKASLPNSDSIHAYGFANKGFHFDIGVSYRFIENVGIAARLGGSICPFDGSAYQNDYAGDFPYISPSSENVYVSGSHYIGEYFIGPFFYFPLSDDFSMELKTMVGLVSAQYPDYIISSTDTNNHAAYNYKFAHAQNFGYCVSLGARYKLDNLIGLSFVASYTGSTITYPGWVYSVSTPSGYTFSGFSFSDRKMQLGILTITAGMTISF